MNEERYETYRESFENRKVLITGGLGFIGSNLARTLVHLGGRVLLVDSLIPEYGGNIFNLHGIEDVVRVNIADVRDSNGMRYLVGGQDVLFNLAGQVSHIDSMEDPRTDLEINCTSQLSILEACRRVNPEIRIVYASTRQIYGKAAKLPADESHPIRPTDVNGINKAAGEMYHQIYGRVHGLKTTSLRLTNTYGPRQLVKHNRQGFIGWFIRRVVLGEEILIFGDGEQKRDFNYVDDVVEALLLAASHRSALGEVFNLGAQPPMSIRQYVETLYQVAGVAPNYRLVPFPDERRRIDIGDFYTDYGKIERMLGWCPKVTLEQGLASTLAYYRAHIERYLS
ncbi:MAG TPA: NAD-dependent epimerase/dehydratase family protein [Vicinamibacteria bacterium]|nr:NAD-dependent epimerase/dehydratase family protein [Vicinamibacteria bacterium]